MKRIIAPLTLAALLSAPCIAQAQETGFYVTPKLGFARLNGYDMEAISSLDEDREKFRLGSDSTYGGGIAVGYNFKRQGVPVRAELEYAMFSNAKSTYKERFEDEEESEHADMNFRTTLGIKTLFVNGYYDFHNDSAFTPYVGLGLGMSFVDMKLSGRTVWSDGPTFDFSYAKKTTTNFAWNLTAGFSYALTKQIGLDLGYRFVWLGKGETKKYYYDVDDYDYLKTKNLTMHQLMLGMRYAF